MKSLVFLVLLIFGSNMMSSCRVQRLTPESVVFNESNVTTRRFSEEITKLSSLTRQEKIFLFYMNPKDVTKKRAYFSTSEVLADMEVYAALNALERDFIHVTINDQGTQQKIKVQSLVLSSGHLHVTSEVNVFINEKDSALIYENDDRLSIFVDRFIKRLTVKGYKNYTAQKTKSMIALAWLAAVKAETQSSPYIQCLTEIQITGLMKEGPIANYAQFCRDKKGFNEPLAHLLDETYR